MKVKYIGKKDSVTLKYSDIGEFTFNKENGLICEMDPDLAFDLIDENPNTFAVYYDKSVVEYPFDEEAIEQEVVEEVNKEEITLEDFENLPPVEKMKLLYEHCLSLGIKAKRNWTIEKMKKKIAEVQGDK
jgi:hypothetical protein